MKKRGALPSAEPFPGITSGFRIQDLGFRISDSGLRIEDLCLVDPPRLRPQNGTDPLRTPGLPDVRSPFKGVLLRGTALSGPQATAIRPNSSRYSQYALHFQNDSHEALIHSTTGDHRQVLGLV